MAQVGGDSGGHGRPIAVVNDLNACEVSDMFQSPHDAPKRTVVRGNEMERGPGENVYKSLLSLNKFMFTFETHFPHFLPPCCSRIDNLNR